MANWYLENGNESDVVVSTRARLLRNISGFNFENKCSDNDKKEILNKVEEISKDIGYGLRFLKLKDMDDITKKTLIEKKVISEDFANINNIYTAILINNEENICIMVNGKDHLEIQVFSEGLAIEESKNLVVEIDKRIETLLQYSYSERYGYLTECPIDIGTGMQISTIVHLPALAKTRNLKKILRIINNFGITIKGIHGDLSENKGDEYLISNNQTLGITEQDIAKNVQLITEKIISQERIARKYLVKAGIEFENEIYRAYGLLAYSRIMSYEECIDLLSTVKLGTDLGVIKELNDNKIKKLLLYTKIANMQKYYGQTLNIEEENIKRAELINKLVHFGDGD